MEFKHANYRFRPLENCAVKKIANDLNHPLFVKAATLKYPGLSLVDVVNKRLVSSLNGNHINLIIFDQAENVCGWVGLIPCPSDANTLETSVYLHPRLWGAALI